MLVTLHNVITAFVTAHSKACTRARNVSVRYRLPVMAKEPIEPKKPEPAEPSKPPPEQPVETPPVEDPQPGHPNEDRPLTDPIPPDGDTPRMIRPGINI